MLKSCKYCGRIHDSKLDCGKKPSGYKRTSYKDKFRWTSLWKNKRDEIKHRDRRMCQVCIRELYAYGARKYNFQDIQVHHIDSLEENYSRRLDNENLIAICSHHHEMAEQGEIPKQVLFDIVREQEYPPTS